VRGLVRNWSAIVLRGIVALVFGVLALVLPGLTIGVLIGIFGAFTIVYGIIAVVSGLVDRGRSRGWVGDVVEGIVAIVAGVFVVAWPDLTATGVLIAIALFAVAIGLTELAAAVGLRRILRRTWPLGLVGAISVGFGVALLAASAEGAVALAWLVGLYAIVFGASLVSFGLLLRRVTVSGGFA
jgi:uncharacterized membrane protein HdeD (DUF308 family)